MIFQKYALFALYLLFFRVKISFWYKIFKNKIKRLKLCLKTLSVICDGRW